MEVVLGGDYLHCYRLGMVVDDQPAFGCGVGVGDLLTTSRRGRAIIVASSLKPSYLYRKEAIFRPSPPPTAPSELYYTFV